MKIHIDRQKQFQTFERFGASGAWWAQIVGGWTHTDPQSGLAVRDRISELLYSKEKGIGLGIYRYNIGAGSKSSGKGTYSEPARRTESFYNDSGEYDWNRATIDEARKIKTARKAATKHYSDGITEFDSGIFDSLFELEDKNEAMLRETALSLKAAKERKDGSAASLRSEISRLQIEKMKIKRKIKSATDEYSNYNRAAKPYLDSKKLLTQRDNYTHYGDILARYEQSKLKAQN